MTEVARHVDWHKADSWSGTFPCLHCGKQLVFFFNGGELEEETCCGHTYRTEIQRVDLVIYEDDE